MAGKNNRQKGHRGLDWLSVTVGILLLVIALISLYKIGNYNMDNHKSKEFSDDLAEKVVVKDDSEDNKIETSQPKGKKQTEEVLIPDAIDFDKLHTISEDAVAWLYAPDEGINYVVAQAEDNEYYLHRLLDGTYASGGTLFMDCRNSADLSDWNTIIYGHHMKNGTMFASLLKYEQQSYFEEHPVMYLYIPGYRLKVELIAGYTTTTDDMVYSIPDNAADRDKIVTHACEQSSFTSDVSMDEDDKLVTLSTCAYDFENARYVVVGKVVEE